MNGWIVAYLALHALGLGFALAKDGEFTKISFWSSLVSSVVTLGILYMGGVFA